MNTTDAKFAGFSSDLKISAEEVERRLNERAARSILGARKVENPQIIRDTCAAYMQVHKNYATYLHAAIKHPVAREWIESESPRELGFEREFDMSSFLLNFPCIWEYEFTEVIGNVNDAMWVASQYQKKWAGFKSVRPMEPDYTFPRIRIPIYHKDNSRFRIGFERRRILKQELGSQFRSLVNFARKRTKKDFLEEFYKPAPDRSKMRRIEYPSRNGGKPMYGWESIFPYKAKLCVHLEPAKLLELTGYTPEEFWQEVKDPTKKIPAHFPGALISVDAKLIRRERPMREVVATISKPESQIELWTSN